MTVSVNLGGASPMDALPWVDCRCVLFLVLKGESRSAWVSTNEVPS